MFILQKLHHIALLSNPEHLGSSELLAKVIKNNKLEAFSYKRNNITEYCDIKSIQRYISFAKDVKVLDSKYGCRINKLNIQDEEDFKVWVNDLTTSYANSNGYSITKLEKAFDTLVKQKRFPTTQYLYGELDPKTSRDKFLWSLDIISSCSPDSLAICRRWIWVPRKKFRF